MNQHPPGQHLTSCSSPENCEEYKSLGPMTTAQYSAWLTQDRERLRTASSARQFRVSAPGTLSKYAPPDSYAPALKKMHKDLPPSPVMRQSPCPFEDKKYTGQPNSAPPNGYQIALDRQKKGTK